MAQLLPGGGAKGVAAPKLQQGYDVSNRPCQIRGSSQEEHAHTPALSGNHGGSLRALQYKAGLAKSTICKDLVHTGLYSGELTNEDADQAHDGISVVQHPGVLAAVLHAAVDAGEHSVARKDKG